MRSRRNNIPELVFLLEAVEKKYGRRIATSTDFEALSVVIEHQVGELLSSSTLKRLWGYVSLNPIPRFATLDILSRYVGCKNFEEFCKSLRESKSFVSAFCSAKYQTITELTPGVNVSIGWVPNRLVSLIYIGGFQFEVISSENLPLIPGDCLVIPEIKIGQSLDVSQILRDGRAVQSDMADHLDGINLLKIEMKKSESNT